MNEWININSSVCNRDMYTWNRHHQSHRVSSAECRVSVECPLSVHRVTSKWRRVSVECPPSDLRVTSSVHWVTSSVRRVTFEWHWVSVEWPPSDVECRVSRDVTRRSLDEHSMSRNGHSADTRRHSRDTWQTLDGHSTGTQHSALDTRWDWWWTLHQQLIFYSPLKSIDQIYWSLKIT